MKGTLNKIDQTGKVRYADMQFLPIHHNQDELKMVMILNTPISQFEGKEVEFEIVEEIPESCHNNPFCEGNETCIQCYIKYAKLINITNNKTIDPYISDNFQIGPDGAYEHEESEETTWDNLIHILETKFNIYFPIRAINYIKNTYNTPIKL